MRMLLILTTLLAVAGCGYSKVDAEQMIASMEEIRTGDAAYINILWYQGHDDEFHYFSYVYGMLRGAKFSVPLVQLDIPDAGPFSDDDKDLVAISRIGDRWQASRLDISGGEWVPDEYGIVIQLR